MKKMIVKALSLLLVVAVFFGLLPVFSYAANAAETYTYVLVRSPKNLTSGEYLLIAAATGANKGNYNYYAMTTKEDSKYLMIQGIGQGFTTLPTTLNLPDSLYSQFAWTVQGDINGLTMKTPDGTYLTATSGSSAVSLTSAGTQWVATHNAEQKTFSFAAVNRYLALRSDVSVTGTNGMCGFTTYPDDTGDILFYVYKRVNTEELKSVLMYHSLNLASDISINYILPKDQFNGFEQIRMEIDRPIFDGNTLVTWETIFMEPVDNGEYFYFTVDDMTAVQMNNPLQAVIYAHKDGVDYITEADYYSIGTYAYNQLDKTASSTALRKVCAELLRYGSKSQVFKNYRTDALVDASMTEEHKAYLSPLEEVVFGSNKELLNDLTNASITWAGMGLDLQTKIVVRMILDLSDYTGSPEDLTMRVKVTDVTGKETTYTLTEVEAYKPEDNLYAFDFSQLNAAELRSVLSAAAFIGETQVSATRVYSVDTYGKGKPGALGETCRAMIAYGDAARAYFEQ